MASVSQPRSYGGGVRTTPLVSLPFGSTLGASSFPSHHGAAQPKQPISNRISTPTGPPPPPLKLGPDPGTPKEGRRVRYAGAEHTLGPTFSEEEDGDDSAFISGRMAALGLDPNGLPYRTGGFNNDSPTAPRGNVRTPVQSPSQAQVQRQFQIQQVAMHQTQQTQQALLLQRILMGQQPGGQNAQLRDAMSLLELQQASNPQLQAHLIAQAQAQAQRAMYTAQNQPGYNPTPNPAIIHQQQQQQLYLQQLQLQQQLHLAAMQQYHQGRQRAMSPDDAEVRARFESAPNPTPTPPRFSPTSPPIPSNSTARRSPEIATPNNTHNGTWRKPSSPSPTSTPKISIVDTSAEARPMGRFAQARKAMQLSSTSEASSSAPAETETSPNASNSDHSAATQIRELGIGRPPLSTQLQNGGRAWTLGSLDQSPIQQPRNGVRSQSMSSPHARVSVIRQPVGPPGGPDELGSKNFASRIRRKAGLNLGMLGRRVESPMTTPVIDQSGFQN
ncbi:hypothetical protein P7C73_g412, partial [Tremellales sp. Uapishka_1]